MIYSYALIFNLNIYFVVLLIVFRQMRFAFIGKIIIMMQLISLFFISCILSFYVGSLCYEAEGDHNND